MVLKEIFFDDKVVFIVSFDVEILFLYDDVMFLLDFLFFFKLIVKGDIMEYFIKKGKVILF